MDPKPSFRRKRLGLRILVILVALAFTIRAGMAFYERLKPVALVETPPRAVKVIRLEPGPFEQTVAVAGTLSPIHSVDVFPKVGGKVTRIYARLGDRVGAGAPLATVEATEYGMQASQADAGFDMASQAADVAQRSLQRLDSVYGSLGSSAMSTQDYESARLQANGAVAQRDMARIQADLARQMVRNATMTAPITGTVSRVLVQQGAMVGSEYPAFHLDDVTALVVRCEIGDLDLPQVRPGQRVRLRTDTLPGVIIEGVVSAVSPTLDAWTRRAPIEIVVPNEDAAITGNLFARGLIVTGESTDALVLPMDTVERTQAGAWVQVVDEGKVSRRPIQIVGTSSDSVSITGLGAGTLVIFPGADHLAEGEAVQPAGPRG